MHDAQQKSPLNAYKVWGHNQILLNSLDLRQQPRLQRAQEVKIVRFTKAR
jgi:hypothetical protein